MAQQAARRSHNPEVVSSILTRGTGVQHAEDFEMKNGVFSVILD